MFPLDTVDERIRNKFEALPTFTELQHAPSCLSRLTSPPADWYPDPKRVNAFFGRQGAPRLFQFSLIFFHLEIQQLPRGVKQTPNIPISLNHFLTGHLFLLTKTLSSTQATYIPGPTFRKSPNYLEFSLWLGFTEILKFIFIMVTSRENSCCGLEMA